MVDEKEIWLPDEEAHFSDDSSSDLDDLKKKSKPSKENYEHEEMDFDLEKYPVREFAYQFPCFGETIAFNPLVSSFGIVVLWGIAVWSMGKSMQALVKRTRGRITPLVVALDSASILLAFVCFLWTYEISGPGRIKRNLCELAWKGDSQLHLALRRCKSNLFLLHCLCRYQVRPHQAWPP